MGSIGPIERHGIFFIKIDVHSIADGKIDKSYDLMKVKLLIVSYTRLNDTDIRQSNSCVTCFRERPVCHSCHLSSQA